MRPLIVAATKEEIKDSIPFLEKHNFPYLITGVGMVATTYALTKHLATNRCDIIINVGIAGSFDKTIKLGTTVEIETDNFSELGAEDDDVFINIRDLGFGEYEYKKRKVSHFETDLPKYNGITVNTVHGAELSISKVKESFPNASVESMEGAAIFYVTEMFKTPSLQIRTISNYVEKRDKSTWNIPLAVNNLNIWLQVYLQNFIK